jgi:hypothetical protein
VKLLFPSGKSLEQAAKLLAKEKENLDAQVAKLEARKLQMAEEEAARLAREEAESPSESSQPSLDDYELTVYDSPPKKRLAKEHQDRGDPPKKQKPNPSVGKDRNEAQEAERKKAKKARKKERAKRNRRKKRRLLQDITVDSEEDSDKENSSSSSNSESDSSLAEGESKKRKDNDELMNVLLQAHLVKISKESKKKKKKKALEKQKTGTAAFLARIRAALLAKPGRGEVLPLQPFTQAARTTAAQVRPQATSAKSNTVKIDQKAFNKLFKSPPKPENSTITTEADLLQAFAFNQEVFRNLIEEPDLDKHVRKNLRKGLKGLAEFHALLSGAEAREFAMVPASKLSPQEAHFVFDQTVSRHATNGQHGKSLLGLFLGDRKLCELRSQFLRAAEMRAATANLQGAQQQAKSQQKGNKKKKQQGEAQAKDKSASSSQDRAAGRKADPIQAGLFNFARKEEAKSPPSGGFKKGTCPYFNSRKKGCRFTKDECKKTHTCPLCNFAPHSLRDKEHLEVTSPFSSVLGCSQLLDSSLSLNLIIPILSGPQTAPASRPGAPYSK